MMLHVKDGLIFRVSAPFDAAPNFGNLCVKGRFGTDFAFHPERLTAPLVRAGERGSFRPAGWDEALDLTAERLAAVVRQYGPRSVGVLPSAKATNEDTYVLQKFARAVLGTNHVDHCSRLCHAASVAALQMAIGSSAMTNSIAEMAQLDTFMVTGSNTTETHPVISLFLKKAVRQHGAKLIVADPRQIGMTDFATLWLRQQPGTDMILFQAMAHVIVAEGLQDDAFIAARTEGFEDYAASLSSCTPEWAEALCGVPADDIRAAARLYAGAERAAIYWGMGISQSVHGTQNALGLVNLALLTGHIGKPYTGLNPLRGQNNVQGCSDSGGLPATYTAYQRVDNPDVRAKFERAWGVPLSPEPGLTVTEMIDAMITGSIRALVVLGENPMMSEPNLTHARRALESLDFLACVDIFPNETTALADVILPAASFAEKGGTFTNSDRRVQPIRPALPLPGAARADWAIVCDLARRTQAALGQAPGGFDFSGPEAIWEEMRAVTPEFYGITYERLEREGGVHWPCPALDHPGSPYLFAEAFPRGRGKFWSLDLETDSEQPDAEYPFNLSTGRVLYHWHGGTQTRRSSLDAAFPEPVVELHPDDAGALGVEDGDWVEVASRRGAVVCRALVTGRSPAGTAFMPFHFVEAAANLLTNDLLDPFAKIPDYKVAAVQVRRAARPPARPGADNPLLARGAIKDPTSHVH